MLSFNTEDSGSIERLGREFGTFRKIKGMLLASEFNLPPVIRKGVVLTAEDLGKDLDLPSLTPILTCRIDLPPSAKKLQYVLRGKNVPPDQVKSYFEEIMAVSREAILIAMEDSTVATIGRHLPRWEYSGGATVMVDWKNHQVAMEFVGPGFDPSYLTRGKCVHHSLLLDSDLLRLPASRMFDFSGDFAGRTYYRADDLSYGVSRRERIEDLAKNLTPGADIEKMEKSIPLELPEVRRETWEKIFKSCLMPLVSAVKRPSEIYGASVNLYENQPYVFEVWQAKDL